MLTGLAAETPRFESRQDKIVSGTPIVYNTVGTGAHSLAIRRRGAKLITRLHPVPGLNILGAVLPLLCASLYRDVCLIKHRWNFPLVYIPGRCCYTSLSFYLGNYFELREEIVEV